MRTVGNFKLFDSIQECPAINYFVFYKYFTQFNYSSPIIRDTIFNQIDTIITLLLQDIDKSKIVIDLENYKVGLTDTLLGLNPIYFAFIALIDSYKVDNTWIKQTLNIASESELLELLPYFQKISFLQIIEEIRAINDIFSYELQKNFTDIFNSGDDIEHSEVIRNKVLKLDFEKDNAAEILQEIQKLLFESQGNIILNPIEGVNWGEKFMNTITETYIQLGLKAKEMKEISIKEFNTILKLKKNANKSI